MKKLILFLFPLLLIGCVPPAVNQYAYDVKDLNGENANITVSCIDNVMYISNTTHSGFKVYTPKFDENSRVELCEPKRRDQYGKVL